MSAVPTSQHSNEKQTKPNFIALFIIALVSLAVLCVLMILSGNSGASVSDANKGLVIQNAQVNTSRIALQSGFTKPRTIFGKLESAQQSDIGFDLSGVLSKVVRPEGSYVKKGEVLASLDTSRLIAQQNELKSALKSAQANAKLASLSANRVQELVNRKLEPQQRLDEAEAQLDATDALVAQAQARLASIDVELAKANIKAPFSGQIVRQYIDEGTVLGAGQAVFSIMKTSALEARFGLPEQTAFTLKVGQTYPIRINSISVNARLISIANERQLATRTIDTVLQINDEELSPSDISTLVSGDLVAWTIDISETKKGAWVPVTALASGVRGMWSLYVINDSAMVETRMVSIEYADNEKAYISGAISENDMYVTEGIHRITPHQKVNNIHELANPISENKR